MSQSECEAGRRRPAAGGRRGGVGAKRRSGSSLLLSLLSAALFSPGRRAAVAQTMRANCAEEWSADIKSKSRRVLWAQPRPSPSPTSMYVCLRGRRYNTSALYIRPLESNPRRPIEMQPSSVGAHHRSLSFGSARRRRRCFKCATGGLVCKLDRPISSGRQ